MLLSETDKNPTFAKMPGAFITGSATDYLTLTDGSTGLQMTEKLVSSSYENLFKKTKSSTTVFETDETKNFGNLELQRLMLLEKLQLICLQKKKECQILVILEKNTECQLNEAKECESISFKLE